MSLFDTGIRPAIDNWLLNKAKEERDYGDYWSASSAGYCMRRVVFERLGVPKVETDADARKQRIFTSGHLFHDWIQKITKEAGLSIAQELELQDEQLMIRGHIDDLVLVGGKVEVEIELKDLPEHAQQAMLNSRAELKPYQRSGHLILYDYKTQNSRAFSYKRPDMSHYHKMQLGTYMYMLRSGKSFGLGIKDMSIADLAEARILKISKDDLRMSEEVLYWSPELEKEVYSYWSTLNGYWRNKKLPKCTCADYEGGFLAKQQYNGYFYEGEPCSLEYYEKWKLTKESLSV